MEKKILIIEDDDFYSDSVSTKLKHFDYETSIAKDGSEGLQKIKEWKPDLVLLDLALPIMDGFDLLRHKLNDKEIVGIPVVVLSNEDEPAKIDQALALGVRDFIVKANLEPGELIKKIKLQLSEVDTNIEDGGSMGAMLSNLIGRKILWVEDEKFLNKLILGRFDTLSCTLVHAANGEEALQKLEKEIPHIIVLDLLLPKMSGMETLKAIRAKPALSSVPIVVVSNLSQQHDIDTAYQAGATKYLLKVSHTLDEILKELNVILGKKKN